MASQGAVMPSRTASSPTAMVSFPWETLAHIYSYCDRPTLAALALVSFGSWQTASPLLYEKVEITSLDQLKSLFYLDIRDEHGVGKSTSIRGEGSLLHRIRSLILNIQSEEQSDMEPKLKIHQPVTWADVDSVGPDSYNPDDEDYIEPHRLVRAGRWTLPSLIVLGAADPAEIEDDLNGAGSAIDDRMLNFYATGLFGHLDPVRFLLRWPDAQHWRFRSLVPPHPLVFGDGWSSLARIELDGNYLITWDPFSCSFAPGMWTKLPAAHTGGRRALEIVYDFSTRDVAFDSLIWAPKGDPFSLNGLSWHISLSREAAERLDLRVVLRVKGGDEASVQQVVDNLEEEWLKKLVVIEAA